VDSLAGRNIHAAFPSHFHAKTSILEEAGIRPPQVWGHRILDEAEIDALGFKGISTLLSPSFLRKGWKAYETLGGFPKALPYHSLFAQVCCAGKAAFQSMLSRW
jgi:hypothetical protein